MLELEASIDQVLGVVGHDHGGRLFVLGLIGAPSKEVNSKRAVLRELVTEVGIRDDLSVDLSVVGLHIVA